MVRPRGKDPNIHVMSGGTSVTGLQNYMIGMNQPFYDVIPNLVSPFGSSNIQYQ